MISFCFSIIPKLWIFERRDVERDDKPSIWVHNLLAVAYVCLMDEQLIQLSVN